MTSEIEAIISEKKERVLGSSGSSNTTEGGWEEEREGERKGGKEGGRKGWRKGGREWREGEREGGSGGGIFHRCTCTNVHTRTCVYISMTKKQAPAHGFTCTCIGMNV